MDPQTVDDVAKILRLLFLVFVAGVGSYLCFKYRSEGGMLLRVIGFACVLGATVNGIALVYALTEF